MKRFGLLIPLVLTLSACATVPVPTDTLMAAEAAIQRANNSRANSPSPTELKAARAKLSAAQDAVARRDMQLATRLAVEAELDADLVTARLAAAKAEFDVEAMKKSNEALRQQALRNAVNVAPIPIPLAPTATQGQNTPFNGGY
jgi:hypothetical protein